MEAEGGGFGPRHPQQLFFDNVSPATRLLEKRRQMYEVQDALESQKARFARDEEQFKKKEDQLRNKDLHLQHQLFRFNKFLQDNEAKRRRAETRAADEAAQIKAREEDIQDLERQLEESKRCCAELEDEVARNMKYEEFLERVKETYEDYHEITDLLTRYGTLEISNRDLMELRRERSKAIEELRVEFQTYRKEQEMEMLELTTRVGTLSQDLEDAQKLRHTLEQQVDESTQEDSKHSLFFGRMLMSVENLFLRCTTKRKNIHHAQDDLEHSLDPDEPEDSIRRKQQVAIRQLKVILAYLKDFKDMVEKLNKQCKQNPARQVINDAQTRPPEVKISFDVLDMKTADRNSQNSGSQSNTREIRKNDGTQSTINVVGATAEPV